MLKGSHFGSNHQSFYLLFRRLSTLLASWSEGRLREPRTAMGKRQNALAAQLRILKKSVFAHVVPGQSLQDVSVELHRFHRELVGRNRHFASQALEECRHLVPAPHRLWARNIHRAAALERHEVFPAAAQAWPALPAGI